MLDPFVDGELSPADDQQVRSHLAECPRCERAVTSLRRFLAAVARVQPVERAPLSLRRRIIRELLDASKKPRDEPT